MCQIQARTGNGVGGRQICNDAEKSREKDRSGCRVCEKGEKKSERDYPSRREREM
jgi:hypothetical protein